VEGRRAEPCVAQRADRAPGKDWLPKIAAVHSITSYPVGSLSEPIFRMHAARKPMKDETHLRNGIGWPLGGTVIIHPVRSAAEPRRRLYVFGCYAFMIAPAGTSPVVR
jgi:hypothetical protein